MSTTRTYVRDQATKCSTIQQQQRSRLEIYGHLQSCTTAFARLIGGALHSDGMVGFDASEVRV
jgi:hypothetical protein